MFLISDIAKVRNIPEELNDLLAVKCPAFCKLMESKLEKNGGKVLVGIEVGNNFQENTYLPIMKCHSRNLNFEENHFWLFQWKFEITIAANTVLVISIC